MISARQRAELLAATEKELACIAARVQRARSPLRGAAAIGRALSRTSFRHRDLATGIRLLRTTQYRAARRTVVSSCQLPVPGVESSPC
jgi:hypothetical protein